MWGVINEHMASLLLSFKDILLGTLCTIIGDRIVDIDLYNSFIFRMPFPESILKLHREQDCLYRTVPSTSTGLGIIPMAATYSGSDSLNKDNSAPS